MTHTREKWDIEKFGDQYHIWEGEQPVAKVWTEEYANLFAAAPELLEACEAAQKWIDYFGGNVPIVAGGEAELSEMLRAAIAKAKDVHP